jgi:hypothetical protein
MKRLRVKQDIGPHVTARSRQIPINEDRTLVVSDEEAKVLLSISLYEFVCEENEVEQKSQAKPAAKPEIEVETPVIIQKDIADMSRRELAKYAKQIGIEVDGRSSKLKLVTAIRAEAKEEKHGIARV